MPSTITCKCTETNEITLEIISTKIIGQFTGIKVKERFINENTSFKDVYISINHQDYLLSDLQDIEITKHGKKPCSYNVRKSPSGNIVFGNNEYSNTDDLLRYISNEDLI